MSTLKKVDPKVLEKMNSVNLLRLYKAERARMHARFPICDCGCYMYEYELYPASYPNALEELGEHELYLNQIKSYLKGKGYIQRPNTHASRVKIQRNQSRTHKTIRKAKGQWPVR
jgi:hypothetical protein